MKEVKTYFTKHWKSRLDEFEYSGWKLLDVIPKDAHILDIGCGNNEFKSHFPNLYGIDIYNEQADQVIDFIDYTPHKDFSHFLALGSLHFGTKKMIDNQIKHLYSITKPGDKIYLRQNPGNTNNEWEEKIQFYPWSLEENKNFCERYKFKLITFKIDKDRYYVEWIRT